jgi:DNA-binding transcriptional regulator YdaS (Cro superfamily)
MKKQPKRKAALLRAVSICGGQRALAQMIGGSVRQAHIWQWLNITKEIPAHRAIDIERATGGVVKRGDLRPDLWPKQ